MIDLNLLREKDPTTWEKFDSTVVAIYEGYEEIYQDGLTDRARLAWLQAVLQEAIQMRGWYWGFAVGTGNAIISKDMLNFIKRSGDSPAEALLRCYLEAIG